jgi:hypothetical protein
MGADRVMVCNLAGCMAAKHAQAVAAQHCHPCALSPAFYFVQPANWIVFALLLPVMACRRDVVSSFCMITAILPAFNRTTITLPTQRRW